MYYLLYNEYSIIAYGYTDVRMYGYTDVRMYISIDRRGASPSLVYSNTTE
jgi:hypothetical protein